MPKKYLILHLNSNGDLLYATAIARQLKEVDDPGCHITWAVATPFRSVLLNNPFIDVTWEVPADHYLDIKKRAFRETEKTAIEKKERGEFDEIICPQLMYENMWRYEGTIRRAVLRAYDKTISNVQPVLRLTDAEVSRVKEFAHVHKLNEYQKIVLFECSPLSGQSSVTPAFAIEMATILSKTNNSIAFILSSNKKITTDQHNIIDGSELSFRENAELTKYCTHFIGCSSGITWISLSDWAKPLPMLQLSSTGINPVSRDFKREGINDQQLVEMYRFDIAKAAECMQLILDGNIQTAKKKFQATPPPSIPFVEGILLYLLNHGMFGRAMRFLSRNLYHANYHPSLFRMVARLPVSVLKKWKNRS